MAVVTVVNFLVHSSNLQTTREYPLSRHVIIYIIMYIYANTCMPPVVRDI